MKAFIKTIEINGKVEILKDSEGVNWRFLFVTDSDGTTIEIDKTIVVQMFQHLVDTKDKRVDVSGWTFNDGVNTHEQ